MLRSSLAVMHASDWVNVTAARAVAPSADHPGPQHPLDRRTHDDVLRMRQAHSSSTEPARSDFQNSAEDELAPVVLKEGRAAPPLRSADLCPGELADRSRPTRELPLRTCIMTHVTSKYAVNFNINRSQEHTIAHSTVPIALFSHRHTKITDRGAA